MWKEVETAEYKHGWHIDAICEHLEALYAGELKHLLLLMPPRHMKSLSVSVMFPAWAWLQNPGTRFLYASYAHSLSIRDSIKCRRILNSAKYREMAGIFQPDFGLLEDQNTKMRFENTYGGQRIATSVDGALTGEGGDIIVVDDPHNVREVESEAVRTNALSWWDEAMSTRLNDRKTGHYIIVLQRSHEKDLAGHIMEGLAKDHEDEWTTLCLPARYEGETRYHTPLNFEDPRTVVGEPLWPEKWDEDSLDSVEGQLGSYGAAAQLQQRPAPREGGLIQSRWFEVVDKGPPESEIKKRLRFWDLAATEDRTKADPDATAGGRISVDKDNMVYIEHISNKWGSPLDVQKEITRLSDSDPRGTKIYMEEEGGASGKNTIDTYSRVVLPGKSFRGVRTTGDKESYVDPLSAYAEAGNVRVVRGYWNKVFFAQCDGFPNASHDDMLDCVAKGFAQLIPKKRAGMWGTKSKEGSGGKVKQQRRRTLLMGAQSSRRQTSNV